VTFLTNVRKRSGELESFDSAKLEASLTSAGAKSEYASKVSETVARELSEGMATEEIKRVAARELGAYDRTAAQRYEAFSKS
jgi:transcriptional regulator NrdR family protein